LDFAFAQEEVECCGNRIGALAQLFRQIALADDYVPGWVALMYFASIGRNPIGKHAKFFLLLSLCTFRSGSVGFETNSARCCNSDRTSQSPR
jgi:hypothetical protein